MAIQTKIDQYPSDKIPNKATQDKYTFAENVYGYLKYFNDKFVPQTNEFVDDFNTTLPDSLINHINAIGEKSSTLNTISSNLNDVINLAKNTNAVVTVNNAIDDVTKLSNSIDVITNKFQTYQGALDGPPDTRLDGSALQVGDTYFDTTANDLRFWDGSQWTSIPSVTYTKAEVDNKFASISAPTPTISIDSLVNENATLTGAYSVCSKCNIQISATKGSVTIDPTNKQFTYTAFDITDSQDNSDVITAYAVEEGYVLSRAVTVNLTVKYAPIVTDDAIVDNDFQTNAVNPNVDGLSF